MAGISPVMMAGIGTGLVSGARAVSQVDTSAASDYQNRVAELNAQLAAEESKRQAAYARNSAQQRAKFAAQGINPSEGSSAAVLDGLKTLSDTEGELRARQIDLARQRAALRYSKAQRTDLLAQKPSLYPDNLGKLLAWE